MKQLLLYVKTTETCQLNCAHCFTNGRNGAKIFFNPEKTANWIKELHQHVGDVQYPSIKFHGGEPFLAPVRDMKSLWQACKDLWPNTVWTTTTNLVYDLDYEKFRFMQDCLGGRISTSWDHSIRFDNKKQKDLWEENVKSLVENGFDIDVIISIDKSLLEIQPIDLIKKMHGLGFTSIHLERISLTGNAILNQKIIPNNNDLDAWLLKWFEQSIEHQVWEWAPPTSMIKDVLSSYFFQTFHGCRCRNNESKTFTINADGSIGGCPNKAVSKKYGTIDQPIEVFLNSPARFDGIVCEQNRNPVCYSCPVFDICNGDCDCLYWQGDICASPKSVMMKIKTERDDATYRKLLGNYMGVE